MSDWITIWSILLAGGVGIYGVMAVLVTIGGAKDIRKLFRAMDKKKRDKDTNS
ncbi:MAG: hypothetical protein HN494_01665 [Opitutae bacterium]|jgi:hypothetical protein|nr:hypothetical protein [Opitutae bacterium]